MYNINRVKYGWFTLCIGPTDVILSSSLERILPGSIEKVQVIFTHRRDSIAQEGNETYTLTINIESPGNFGNDTEIIIISRLNVTIEDANCECIVIRNACSQSAYSKLGEG